MAKTLQEAFIDYNNAIKLKMKENSFLMEKRDMLFRELDEYFKKYNDENNTDIKVKKKNQGSYSMGTGIKPLDGEDYDIDLMLLFNISIYDAEAPSAKQLKEHVKKALDKYSNRDVKIKKPCVRVQYMAEGEPTYHVDLAVYAKNDMETFLSKKPQYASDDEEWEPAEPEKLHELIRNFSNDAEERHQFRRVIRYLKRWKDLNFKGVKDGKLTGIAITAIALKGFRPKVEYDSLANRYNIDDLEATIRFVNFFLDQFDSFLEVSISEALPVKPRNNLFSKFSSKQCRDLKDKLIKLRDKLEEVQLEVDPHQASKTLRQNQVFGKDFPLILKEEVGQHRNRAIINSPDQA